MTDQPRPLSRLQRQDDIDPDAHEDADDATLADEIVRIATSRPDQSKLRTAAGISDISSTPLGKAGTLLAGRSAKEPVPTDGDAPQPPNPSPSNGVPRSDAAQNGMEDTSRAPSFDRNTPPTKRGATSETTGSYRQTILEIATGLLGRDNNVSRGIQGLFDLADYVQGNPGRTAYEIANLISPAEDIKEYKEGVINAFIAAREGDWEKSVAQSMRAVAGIAGVVVPGSSKIRKAGRELGKVLEDGLEEGIELLRRETRSQKGPKSPGELGPLTPHNDPLMINDRTMPDWTPKDLDDFGRLYGVKDLGRVSPPVAFRYENGQEFQIPGGLEGTFSYYDLLQIRADAIDASRIPVDLHKRIQDKIMRTMMPDDASDEHIFNMYLFGMLTANQPHGPSQLVASKMRARSIEAIEQLAAMVPWEPGAKVSRKERRELDKRIAEFFELQAKEQGGLGIRGTVDYSRVAEFAKMYLKDPAWFRRKPDESWEDLAERAASQIGGLGIKTASIAIGWQDPLYATVSQLDRHLTKQDFDKLFATPESKQLFSEKAVQRWNEKVRRRQRLERKYNDGKLTLAELRQQVRNLPGTDAEEVEDVLEIVSQPGGDGFITKQVMPLIQAKRQKLHIDGPDGPRPNPELSESLQQTDWVVPMEHVKTYPPTYRLAQNAAKEEAARNGQGLFAFTAMEWDRARGLMEPHEHMYPGLEKLPLPATDQYRLVQETMRKGRATDYRKTTVTDGMKARLVERIKVDNPMHLAYLGVPFLAAVPAWEFARQSGSQPKENGRAPEA